MTEHKTEYISGEFEIRSMHDDDGIFEGYASRFHEILPSFQERVMPGAFKKTLKEHGGQVPILKNHDSHEWIGMGVSAFEDKFGLPVVGELNLDVQAGREQQSLMRMSLTRKVKAGISIGFISMNDEVITESVQGRKTPQKIRQINEIKLIEYSITPFPAAPKARVKKVRSLMQEIRELPEDERSLLIAEFNITTEADDEIIEPGFSHSIAQALREVTNNLRR